MKMNGRDETSIKFNDDLSPENIDLAVKYFLSASRPIEFDANGIPLDICKAYDQMKNLSESIKNCWHILPEQTQEYYRDLAKDFRRAKLSIRGRIKFLIKIKLLIPSIQKRQNLFKKYKEFLDLMPKTIEEIKL